MISLGGTLKEQIDRVYDLFSPRELRRSQSIFYHSCRLLVGQPEQAKKYRVAILVRSPNCIEAEKLAESHLNDLIQHGPDEFNGNIGIRWLKGRLLSSHPHKDESETVVQLLSQLRHRKSAVVSAVERIDA
jgi:hypothetical protein